VLLALSFIAALWVATLRSYDTPPALGQDASPDKFSAGRSLALLRPLLGEAVPHPIGSEANRLLRARIVAQLQALGYVPQLQSDVFVCNPQNAVCAAPTNILVRISASDAAADQGNSILLAAHYDSVAAGPGASDDGTSVAAILEIARILKLRSAPRHPIILLLDEGEELGLLGAVAFVQKHPWAASVRAAVNLDARGTSGPSMMFETGAANAWLMQLYRQAMPRPMTNSVYYTVYKHMPNGTDFTVFKRAGYQGYNFAYIGDVSNYHSPHDDLAHVDPRSMQDQGERALAMVLALADADLDAPNSDEAVYFDLFGRVLLVARQAWVLPCAGLTLVLFALITVLLLRRRIVDLREMLRSLLVFPLGAIVAAGLAGGLLQFLAWTMPARAPTFAAHPGVLHTAFAALAALCMVSASSLLAGRVGFWSLWCSYGLGIATFACGLAAVLPGASYLLLLPAMLALSVAGARAANLWRGPGGRDTATLTLLAGLFLLMWPILVPLYQGLGRPGLLLETLLLYLAAVPLVGLLMLAGRSVRRSGFALSGALLLTSIGAAVALPAYTAESPETLNLKYLLDRTEREHTLRARWVILSESDRIPGALQRLANFATSSQPFNPLIVNWYGSPMIAAPAPLIDLPEPTLKVQSSKPGAAPGRRHYRILVAPQRPSAALQVAFPPSAQVESVIVHAPGPLPEAPVRLELFKDQGWTLMTLINPASEGQQLEFDATAEPFAVSLLDLSLGLPPSGKPLLDARPNTTIARHYGSVTGVAAVVTLPTP